MAKKTASKEVLSPGELKKQLGTLEAAEKEFTQEAEKLAMTKQNAADMIKELDELDLET